MPRGVHPNCLMRFETYCGVWVSIPCEVVVLSIIHRNNILRMRFPLHCRCMGLTNMLLRYYKLEGQNESDTVAINVPHHRWFHLLFDLLMPMKSTNNQLKQRVNGVTCRWTRLLCCTSVPRWPPPPCLKERCAIVGGPGVCSPRPGHGLGPTQCSQMAKEATLWTCGGLRSAAFTSSDSAYPSFQPHWGPLWKLPFNMVSYTESMWFLDAVHLGRGEHVRVSLCWSMFSWFE